MQKVYPYASGLSKKAVMQEIFRNFFSRQNWNNPGPLDIETFY